MNKPGWFLILLAGAGCTSTGDDIDSVDAGGVTGMVRVTIQDLPPADADSKDRTKSTIFAELSLEYGAGEDEQSLDADEKFVHDDKVLRGPLDSDAEFAFVRLSALARIPHDFSETFGMEVIAGASILYFETELDTSVGPASEVDGSFGPVVGAQFNVRPWEPLTLYGRGLLRGGLGHNGDVVTGEAAFEAGLEVNVTDQIYFFGGWSGTEFHLRRHDESDIFFDHSGPFAGLGLRF